MEKKYEGQTAKDIEQKERKRLQKISEMWFLTEPLLFNVFCTHSLVANDAPLITMRTGKMRIEFNPIWTETLSDSMLEEYLKVEVLRILLKHPYQRQPPLANKAALYFASDVTISEHYKTAAQIKTRQDFNLESGLCFEEYYAQILPMMQQDKNEASSTDDSEKADSNSNGEADSNGKLSNTDEQPEENSVEQKASAAASLWEENDAAQETVNAEIERAEQINSWGTLNGRMVEMIRASKVVQMDYRQMLSKFRATVLSSKRHLTRMKPSRRYDFLYMGSKHDFTTKLLVAVDVSGSVTSKSLATFFSIINRFFKYGIETIDVVQFDYNLKGEPESIKKAKKDVKIIGRGGTDFQPVIDFYEKNRKYDGLIMFTDGYAPHPETHKAGNNILWIFTSKREYETHAWVRNMRGSRATYIPIDK